MQELDQHPVFISPDEPTAALGEVGTKTVEQDDKPWDVKSISDRNPFPNEGNDGGNTAKEGNKGIVAHANLEIGHSLV